MRPLPDLAETLGCIEHLGTAELASPIAAASEASFIDDATRLFVEAHLDAVKRVFAGGEEPASFEVAGPRLPIYFDPARCHAAIVTCGGLVKLMGRHAGYIAAHATLSSGAADFCLIPEVPFALGGPGGLFPLLESRLAERSHAVIVLAEGRTKTVDPGGELWRNVLEATGQPPRIGPLPYPRPGNEPSAAST